MEINTSQQLDSVQSKGSKLTVGVYSEGVTLAQDGVDVIVPRYELKWLIAKLTQVSNGEWISD